MLRIKKGEPWVFWPSHICDTFPENPANKILTGAHSFNLYLDFTLKNTADIIGTIFTLLPHYTALDIYKGTMLFTLMNKEKETKYENLDVEVKDDANYKFKLEHIKDQVIRIFINNRKVYEKELQSEGFAIETDPHIIFAAGNFPKNNFNLNYLNLDLHEFYIEQDSKIIAHHKFEEYIFDKSVDITGNCNFINKI